MADTRASDHLRQHRSHDVRALIQCWREAVKGSDFRLRNLGTKDGHPIISVTKQAQSAEPIPGFYVSSGIHGDEPAPPWALLDWFERGGFEKLGHRPIVLFPCLNPLGLAENHRSDGEGRDLNRIFDAEDICPIHQVRQTVAGHRFQLAICLHEDYDGRGAYVYDLNRAGDSVSARTLLKRSVTRRLGIDLRTRIDGRKADEGVIFRRRLDRRNIPGLPEAVFLFLDGHAERTLTFETPSEFSLADRVEVHRRFLEAASTWCAKQRT